MASSYLPSLFLAIPRLYSAMATVCLVSRPLLMSAVQARTARSGSWTLAQLARGSSQPATAQHISSEVNAVRLRIYHRFNVTLLRSSDIPALNATACCACGDGRQSIPGNPSAPARTCMRPIPRPGTPRSIADYLSFCRHVVGAETHRLATSASRTLLVTQKGRHRRV